MSTALSAPRHLNRRQSFGLAAWAVAGMGCGPRPSEPPAAAAQGAAAGPPAPPPPPPPFAGISDPDVLRFYEARGWRPAWTPDLAGAFSKAAGDARRHGLDPAIFAPKAANGADPTQRDIGLSVAAIRYARALASGFVDPRTVEKIFTLARNEVDLAWGLEQALVAAKLADWLASLAPTDPEYQALSAAWLAATDGESPPRDRARQLAANLERRRWLSRAPPETRIDVNTASCLMVYLRPGVDPWAARVVAGRAGHETPSIQGTFHRLVANPPWRVPMDIARKEILPKGGGYLSREHMRVVDGVVVQQPGPHSSLGVVKFDVEDPYEIYLHDTPSKSAFALPERHRSHGCVRVQNAVGLARLIAGQNGKADEFDKALSGGKTVGVDIGEAITVRLLYHTAYLGDDGRIAFAPDAYGWNDHLAEALGLGRAAGSANDQQTDTDVGP